MEDNPQELLDELLSKVIESKSFQGNTEDIILVGGVALGYWFNRYSDRLTALESDVRLSVPSFDIDFIGTKEASSLIYEELRAELESDISFSEKIESIGFAEPDLNSSTPNTAIISIKAKGFKDPFIIDFLGDIKGMDSQSLKKTPNINDAGVRVRILSPVQLIRSRLANLYGLGYGPDRYERELKRIKVSSLLCAEYIADLLDTGESKEARKALQTLYQVASSQHGISMFCEHGLAIEKYVKLDLRLGDDFTNRELPALKLKVNNGRQAYFNRVQNNKKNPGSKGP